MTTKPIIPDPENPAPESDEQEQASIEASLTSTSKATTGGTGSIKVTG
ncbi:MAG: hypothetical protein LWW79_03705 [Holophagaceae bacterium]|nr:hypothetical protein [Holophagaceae bacterium]